jgi:CHAT domain-containing protein
MLAALGQVPARDSAAARHLWLAALDAEARLKMDSAIALLARARATDPRFFPAQHKYLRLRWDRGEFNAIRHLYAVPDPRGGTVTECLALATAAFPNLVIYWLVPANGEPLARLVALERRGDPSGCAATCLHQLRRFGVASNSPDPVTLAYARRATVLAPEVLENWGGLAGLLRRAGRTADAVAVIEDGLRQVPGALARVRLWHDLIDALRSSGDSLGAWRLLPLVAVAAARDGRPGVRQVVGLRLRTDAGDWFGRLALLEESGRDRVDHGDPAGAMLAFDSAVALADSVQRPWPRLVARMYRGRAESKLGRLKAAEDDLRAALAAGADAPDMYYLAETWHNLAHVYEGQGRWTEAATAVDHFVALASPMRFDAHRVVSLRDAGVIRWEAGWHAAALADFASMVRAVDDQSVSGFRGGNEYWAGEYFERIGDLARAIAYYRASRSNPDLSEPLGALARVYEVLGKDDSAELAAIAHDSMVVQWKPLEGPILPGFLARHGRMQEAVAIARRWAERQVSTGNVQGAAIAALELGALELNVGAPTEALAAAQRADSLAATLHLVDERVRAGELSGKALFALGQHDAGLATLRRTAALAAAHPTTTSTFATQLALGNALGATGHPAGALVAYDRAARTVQDVTGRLVEDLDRAGYRDRHLEPFDGALSVLLAEPPSPGRSDALVLWSERRKAAALALATGGVEGGGHQALRSRSALQRLVGPHEAIVDYLVLPSAVAAIVMTTHQTSVVPLPVTPDSLRSWAIRLRRPLNRTYVGRLDLARAPFDLALAHRLYERLIQPLEPVFVGHDRLAIVPDGPLYLVPFAALVSELPRGKGSYGEARYLIDHVEVRYLPSTQFLGATVHQGGEALRVLAVEGNAPGAEQEVVLMRAALGGLRVDVLTAGAATKSAVFAAAAGHSVLHFAVHAVADGRDPLASHLRLTSESRSEGYLHLNEIARARWPVQLVVLSACETLDGPVYNGEGMMGLARAFLEGGAHTVVATGWPIGATSADLMGEFYRHIARGSTPVSALRAAQLALRHAPATSHPFYWASFVTIEGR